MTTKKKIGIVTFNSTKDNYGQVLQYLATQIYLEKRGHDVFLYETKGHRRYSLIKVYRKIRKILGIKKQLPISLEEDYEKQIIFQKWANLTNKYDQEHPRYFMEFRNTHFHQKQCYYEDLKGVYALGIGSDQTFTCVNENYFLHHLPRGIKRFSLAASAGHKTFTQSEIDYIAPALHKFDFITVRESNGLELCKRCGMNDAKIVLDPTFLIDADTYNQIAGDSINKHPYILLYLLGGEIDMQVSKVYKWAKERNLNVIYIPSQGREDEYEKCFATIEEWLAYIRDAEYIFTNSFHGMSLALIYHKQFLTFPLTGIMKGMNGRIYNLAKQMGVEEHISNSDLTCVQKPINWTIVEKAIQNNQKIVNDLLTTINL